MSNSSSATPTIDLTEVKDEDSNMEIYQGEDEEYITPPKSPRKKSKTKVKKELFPESPEARKPKRKSSNKPKRKAKKAKVETREVKAHIESKPKKRARWDCKIQVQMKKSVKEVLFKIKNKEEGPELSVVETEPAIEFDSGEEDYSSEEDE